LTRVNSPKNRILAAAARVFADKGAREATVEDLLEAAQVSRRTFYLAWRNKEEVLAALYQIACGLVLEALKAAAESAAQPVHKLERCVDAYLAFNRTQPDLMRVLEGEALRADSLLQPLRAELLDKLGEVVAKAVGGRPDRLVIRGVLVGLEAISHEVHAEGPPTEARMARARKAMLRILIASLVEK
jgi:AcrR family transcriptional regulator